MAESTAVYLGQNDLDDVVGTLTKFNSDALISANELSDEDVSNFRTVIKHMYRIVGYDNQYMMQFMFDTFAHHVTAMSDEEINILRNELQEVLHKLS